MIYSITYKLLHVAIEVILIFIFLKDLIHLISHHIII